MRVDTKTVETLYNIMSSVKLLPAERLAVYNLLRDRQELLESKLELDFIHKINSATSDSND